ncbi:hypothetical protein POPTR_014G077700v4 [Populus trichocarpa]|uniref:Uncharacterized protein n=1 Tax=Populus trichocarpa TaxID=3694 RepID=A0A2K1XS28_POPTR|nr:uncharacterized protein LOC7496934 [Populus trichocarpa]PNT03582.1 hypothetical protein POPTR_014G077700v4 [Populus trichocarpa]|eukprot:XP_024440252.1 uncharacterized protein LOC7496934 [Populus trichocarpa]
MASEEEAAAAAKLERFLQWLQVNKVELRGCNIKYCGQNKGFGVFSSNDVSDGVLLVVPLDLAITPMRVLQDPLIGPECRSMFEEGEVDDRFLMILFLMLERLRNNSSWKPYLDMLPKTFGNPLWFTDDELLELKGTTLYRATELQRKRLLSLYEDKVKGLVQKLLILDGDLESEVCFEDFLWANSVFWTRALNIPLPRSYVFPQVQEDQDSQSSLNIDSGVSHSDISAGDLTDRKDEERSKVPGVDGQFDETVWVEGLVPGIDFCNHDLKAVATWEVDGTGMTTGVPHSMYLLSAVKTPFQMEKEITISYGNKGNEELLYLYGFVIDNNPDEYLMVHYPVEAIQNVPFSDSKMQLLEAQKAEMRCLLPKRLLAHGFFPAGTTSNDDNGKGKADKICSFSWSGQRRMPSYANKLVFPEEFLTTLRTIAMQEDELLKASSFLEELVGSEGVRQPTDTEVRTAVWEACGDSGALQLLFDLLQTKVMNLEENFGTEDCDTELLEKAQDVKNIEQCESKDTDESGHYKFMSRNRWSSIVYRKGQKQLARLFLKEAEHVLHLSLSEGE